MSLAPSREPSHLQYQPWSNNFHEFLHQATELHTYGQNINICPTENGCMIVSVKRLDNFASLDRDFKNQPAERANELFQAAFEAHRGPSSAIETLYLNVISENDLEEAFGSHVSDKSATEVTCYPATLKATHLIIDTILRKFSSVVDTADETYEHLSSFENLWSEMLLDPDFGDEFIASMVGYLKTSLSALKKAKDKRTNIESWKKFWRSLRQTFDFTAKLLLEWPENEGAE